MKPAISLIVVVASIAASGGRAVAAGAPAAEHRDCSVGEVRRLVGGFIRAFNTGDASRLETIFAPAASFKWYSTSGPARRLNERAYDRSTLIRYFAARHARREHLTLTFWEGGGNANGYAHFRFRLVRQSRDFRPAGYEGKGAAICSAGGDTIAVWSMGPR